MTDEFVQVREVSDDCVVTDITIDMEFVKLQIESLEAEIDFFKKRMAHNEKLLEVLRFSLESTGETNE